MMKQLRNDRKLYRSYRHVHNFKIAEMKEKEILAIFEQCRIWSTRRIEPVVIESYEASIQQNKPYNEIICDAMFLDIATMVAAIYYSGYLRDVDRLSSMLLACKFVCSDDLSKAVEYGHKFARGPMLSVYGLVGNPDRSELLMLSRRFQTLFAILHELAHFEFCDKDNYLARSLEEELTASLELHNKIAEAINKVDLTPIEIELQSLKIAKKNMDPFSLWKSILKLVKDKKELIAVPTEFATNKNELIIYACDNFINERCSPLFLKSKIVEEATCDLIALFQMFTYRISGKTREESLKFVIESYVLCLLTQNMIQTVMNIEKINISKSNIVDYIYMRKQREEGLLFTILNLYSSAYKEELSDAELLKLVSASEEANQAADLIYAEFSEYISRIDLSDKNEYIPIGTTKWNTYYAEVDRLLTLPV